ncbi:MAG: hypothetical protein FWF46_05270 [Oscillospiraceae bacterium]|nr:hypothetical protein [Oscillospiraceae bacterium]
MKSKKRNYVVIALIVLLVAVGIGYAALGGVLNITGTAKTNAFDVRFTTTDTGTISNDGQTVTVSDVVLNAPGDSKVITCTLKNQGSTNATIDGFKVEKTSGTQAEQDAIDITVTPDVDSTSTFPLNSGDTQTVTVTVKWNDDATSADVINAAVGFTITANYSQDV